MERTAGGSDSDLISIAEGAELCWLSVQCCWPAKKHADVSFITEIKRLQYYIMTKSSTAESMVPK